MTDPDSVGSRKERMASALGTTTDPLADINNLMVSLEDDPFELFLDDDVRQRNITTARINRYVRTVGYWQDFMTNRDRHPSCPRSGDVKDFADERVDVHGDAADTVRNQKLLILKHAFEYFSSQELFPHPPWYNPVKEGLKKFTRQDPEKKPLHRITLDEMKDIIQEVKHVRRRLIIVLMIKGLLRAGELSNLKISEIHVDDPELLENYPEMGTSPYLQDHENVMYIPYNRSGNKSQRPKLVPLDDEAQRTIRNYLVTRPDNGEPWLLLSDPSNGKMEPEHINERWKDVFHPEYAENEMYRGITSHYGRHWGTTRWRIHIGLQPELLEKLRGDKVGDSELQGSEIPTYLHTYYPDLEQVYRDNVYKFGI